MTARRLAVVMPPARGSRDEFGVLDRLQDMLAEAGVSEDEMRAGIELTALGRQKVAARLGLGADEVPMLLGSLCTRLRDDAAREESAFESAYQDALSRDAPEEARYGYEADGMGNVTVRDVRDGTEAYLQGSRAADLLRRLRQDPDGEQAVLATVAPLLEAASPSRPPDAGGDDYMAEMRQKHGTFNFPWTAGGRHGFGTARYAFAADAGASGSAAGADGGLQVRLLSVRDADGQPVGADGALRVEIEQVALDFLRDQEE